MKTYVGNLVKRDVQRKSLASKEKTIFGLGGPSINEYIKVLKELGYKDIILFENDYEVFKKQKKQKPQCVLLFDDILNHLGEDGFYDFDFCSTIKKVEPWMPQIVATPKYSLTFSLRGTGYNGTISTFKKYSEAKYIPYHDTSAMITFFS